MNKQKAMMDALMGACRDTSRKDKTGEEFADGENCKHYLIGFCPDGLFITVWAWWTNDIRSFLVLPPFINTCQDV